MHLIRLTISLCCVLVLGSPCFSNALALKCDTLVYDELLKRVDASGHVQLKLNDSIIKASSLSFYVEDDYIISSENVSISQKGDTFQSSSLFIDLKAQSLSLTDIYVSVDQPGQKGKLYVSIKEMLDRPRYKIGKSVILTSCNSSPPHHYLKAWKAYYYPDKSVHLFGGYFRNDLTIPPFNFIPYPVPFIEVFPVPYYYYQLGERKLILNFPTIGKKSKDTWGWFVQNTIDYRYKHGKESSLFLDWYEAKNGRKGEWGYGIRHHYGSPKHFGSIYYYNYDFKSNGLAKRNSIYELQQTFSFSNTTYSGQYKVVDVDERINTSGEDNILGKSLRIDHDTDGFPLSFSIQEHQQIKYQYTSLDSNISKTFLHQDLSLNLNKQRYNTIQKEKLSSSLTHSKRFKHDITFSQTVDFYQQDFFNDSLIPDQSLTYESIIQAPLPYHIDLTIRFNIMQDLEQDRVTADSNSGINNYLFKLPEIELSKSNYSLLSFNGSSTFRFGHYKEVKYLSSTSKSTTFPAQDSGIEPNIYYIHQTFSKNISSLPFNSVFSFNTGVEQYIFKNKNYSLFAGDAQYNFNLNASLDSTFLNFIKLQSSYTSQYAPKENNSPFYAYKHSLSEVNSISESLIFFYDKEKTTTFPHSIHASWEHSTGYNWLRDTQPYNDYRSNLKLSLSHRYTLTMSMSQKLNFPRAERFTKYSPLYIGLYAQTLQKQIFDYSISFDLNDVVFKDQWNVKHSAFLIKFPVGSTPDLQWHINGYYQYNPDQIGRSFAWDAYQLQTLSITKKEHKRVLEVGYNKLMNEWFFKYTFTIFPEDPIVLRKRQDILTFEGRLSKQSEERFK